MPMFMMGRHTHWQMVGMPMDAWMLWGMAMIPAGVVLAGFGLMPRLAMMRESLPRGGHLSGRHQHFHVAAGVPLNRAPWTLAFVPLRSEDGRGGHECASRARCRWT